MTDDIVNQYIKENHDIVSNYLRNERLMETQKRQMNARSLLNNAFYFFIFLLYIYIIIKMPAKSKSAFMPKGYEMNNKLMENGK